MTKTLIAVLMLGGTLLGQGTRQTTPEDAATAEQLTMHVVYGAFFRHVLALEDAAIEHDKAGRKGSEVRAYYQTAMKLTDAEAATVKRVAAQCQAGVHELDISARKVINAAWAPYPDHRVPVGEKPPAVPEELRRLDRERIETIEAHIKELEIALGPVAYQKINNQVRNVFAKQMSVTSIRRSAP